MEHSTVKGHPPQSSTGRGPEGRENAIHFHRSSLPAYFPPPQRLIWPSGYEFHEQCLQLLHLWRYYLPSNNARIERRGMVGSNPALYLEEPGFKFHKAGRNLISFVVFLSYSWQTQEQYLKKSRNDSFHVLSKVFRVFTDHSTIRRYTATAATAMLSQCQHDTGKEKYSCLVNPAWKDA